MEIDQHGHLFGSQIYLAEQNRVSADKMSDSKPTSFFFQLHLNCSSSVNAYHIIFVENRQK